VPADPSSSTPPGLTALGHADRLRSAETPHLLSYLAPSPTQGPRRAPASAPRHPGARRCRGLGGCPVDRRDRRVGRGRTQPVCAALGTRHVPLPTAGCGRPHQDHDPPDARPRGPEALAAASARGLPTATGPARPASVDGQWRSTARRCAAPASAAPGPAGPPARRDGHATRTVLANVRSTAHRARFPGSGHCWPTWTLPAWS
jgi:hypothetical protein